jgi:hypothetical protein
MDKFIKHVRDPRYWIHPCQTLGGVTLSLYHPDYGWVYFQIPMTEVADMIELLKKHNSMLFQPANFITQPRSEERLHPPECAHQKS